MTNSPLEPRPISPRDRDPGDGNLEDIDQAAVEEDLGKSPEEKANAANRDVDTAAAVPDPDANLYSRPDPHPTDEQAPRYEKTAEGAERDGIGLSSEHEAGQVQEVDARDADQRDVGRRERS